MTGKSLYANVRYHVYDSHPFVDLVADVLSIYTLG